MLARARVALGLDERLQVAVVAALQPELEHAVFKPPREQADDVGEPGAGVVGAVSGSGLHEGPDLGKLACCQQGVCITACRCCDGDVLHDCAGVLARVDRAKRADAKQAAAVAVAVVGARKGRTVQPQAVQQYRGVVGGVAYPAALGGGGAGTKRSAGATGSGGGGDGGGSGAGANSSRCLVGVAFLVFLLHEVALALVLVGVLLVLLARVGAQPVSVTGCCRDVDRRCGTGQDYRIPPLEAPLPPAGLVVLLGSWGTLKGALDALL